MNAGLQSVPLAFPGGDFGPDLLLIIQSTTQALTVHDADFCLRHIHPAAVLGRVVPLNLVQ